MPVDAADRRNRRMLYDDVCAAKERLSRTSQADIHLPALEVDAHVTRDELEALIRPYLARTVVCLARTIDSARLSATELVGIFLVGGSSRIPLAATMILTELGVAPTTLDQPETVVAEGALCIGGAPSARLAPAGGLAASPVPGPARPGSPLAGSPVSGTPLPGSPVSGSPRPGSPLAGPLTPMPGQPVSGQPVSGRAAAGKAPPGQLPPSQAPPGQAGRNRPGVDQPMAGQAGRNRPVAGRAQAGQAVPAIPGRQGAGGQQAPGRSASPPRQAPPPAQSSPPAGQQAPVGRAVPPVGQQRPDNRKGGGPPLSPTRPMSAPLGAPQSPALSGHQPAGAGQSSGVRRWYTEPAAIATAIVLALVVVAFVILLSLASQSQ
jgi:hypothetical protein